MPRLMQDLYVVDGLAIPRIFLSAQTGLNLEILRQRLLDQAQQHDNAHLTLVTSDEPG